MYDSIITTPKDINSVNHILEQWSRTRAVPGVSIHGSNMLSNEVAQSAFYSNTKSGSLHTSAKKLWLTLLNNWSHLAACSAWSNLPGRYVDIWSGVLLCTQLKTKQTTTFTIHLHNIKYSETSSAVAFITEKFEPSCSVCSKRFNRNIITEPSEYVMKVSCFH